MKNQRTGLQKNILKPRELFKNCNKKYIFHCNICNHDFTSTLNNITSNNNWCPYCAIYNKILCTGDCSMCYNMSFASHEKAKYWSKKNTITPREVRKCSNMPFIFVCNNCEYEFSISLNNVSAGRWCPVCKNTTEKKLLDWLKNKYDVKYQVRYSWCRNPDTQYYLSYDYEINNKIMIELDGRQHFEQVGNWRSPDEENKRDRYKVKCALENNKHIIHIYQEDVLYDKNEWYIKLENEIKDCLLNSTPILKTIGIDIAHFS